MPQRIILLRGTEDILPERGIKKPSKIVRSELLKDPETASSEGIGSCPWVLDGHGGDVYDLPFLGTRVAVAFSSCFGAAGARWSSFVAFHMSNSGIVVSMVKTTFKSAVIGSYECTEGIAILRIFEQDHSKPRFEF